jgi:nitrogen fixation protein FixH
MGMLVVFLGANAVMIYLAVDTNPGLVTSDYYERGRAYERGVSAREAQAGRYQLHLDVPAELRPGEPVTLRVVVVDQAGVPLEADTATLYVYRPSDAEADFSVPMRREGSGRYVAELVFPLKGIWDVIASVQDGEQEHNLPRRVSVRTP